MSAEGNEVQPLCKKWHDRPPLIIFLSLSIFHKCSSADPATWNKGSDIMIPSMYVDQDGDLRIDR